MKHLFFVAVAVGIFLGTPQLVHAQANVNLERLSAKNKANASLKFIDNIELVPQGSVAGSAVEIAEPVKNKKETVAIVSKENMPFTIEQCNQLQFKYAMMMDVDVEAVANKLLYNFIDDWWGTRYRYGGTDRRGIDCSAFCSKLMTNVYGVNLDRTAREQFRQCEKIANEDLKEGDLVFFNTRGGVSHVGFYLGNNYFVHSSVHTGVTISSLTDDYYSKKFISGGRICK